MNEILMRNLSFAVSNAAALVLSADALVKAAQFGTAEEAKAMLERAVAAVKQDKHKALDMFGKGEGGFRGRDLYVACANAADGTITARPTTKGEHLQDIRDTKGFPLGQEMMQKAAEGTIKEVTYWWPLGGRALAPISRWRRLPSIQRSAIRFAVSATMRNEHRSAGPSYATDRAVDAISSKRFPEVRACWFCP